MGGGVTLYDLMCCVYCLAISSRVIMCRKTNTFFTREFASAGHTDPHDAHHAGHTEQPHAPAAPSASAPAPDQSDSLEVTPDQSDSAAPSAAPAADATH